MAKQKVAFFCQNCGYESAKWLGKCPSCDAWNTFVEEILQTGKAAAWDDPAFSKKSSKPVPLEQISADNLLRINTGNDEFNRVLGGGIVKGSLILIGGEPGIGKSTLMLQIMASVSLDKSLYISGEESAEQIKLRAERVGLNNEHSFILTETNTQHIFQQLKQLGPDLIIVDSIQTLYSNSIDSVPGSIGQIRQTAGELMKYAKQTGVPVILIGHITKDGSLAGPKVLEHMVDTVLQFEGDRNLFHRILRTTKNRFGSASELGIFEMSSQGLKEVKNPSDILISHKNYSLPGVAIGASLEGNRPLLIEIQSLVSTATYGTPQRSTTGFDPKRLNMLLAVLEKRAGIKLASQDVFVNVAGGLKVNDPALDLAVCESIISSYYETPVKSNLCFSAEVGLGGELRAVTRIEDRIKEAGKMGFAEMFISDHNPDSFNLKNTGIKVSGYSQLKSTFKNVLANQSNSQTAG